jgi:hypothetical protein
VAAGDVGRPGTEEDQQMTDEAYRAAVLAESWVLAVHGRELRDAAV